LILSSINFPAAALIATGLLVKAVREVAASYTTVFEDASSRSKINLKYLAYITPTCKKSPYYDKYLSMGC